MARLTADDLARDIYTRSAEGRRLITAKQARFLVDLFRREIEREGHRYTREHGADHASGSFSTDRGLVSWDMVTLPGGAGSIVYRAFVAQEPAPVVRWTDGISRDDLATMLAELEARPACFSRDRQIDDIRRALAAR